MAAAAILEIEKSPYLGRGLTVFDEIWHGVQVWSSWAFQAAKFQKLKNRHILAAIWRILTKFGMATHFGPLEPSDP